MSKAEHTGQRIQGARPSGVAELVLPLIWVVIHYTGKRAIAGINQRL